MDRRAGAAFPVFLTFILMLWMGSFDIIYATQDEASDRETGLHSVPVRFRRRRAPADSPGSHVSRCSRSAPSSNSLEDGVICGSVTGFMTAAILYIHLFRKNDDLDAMNRDFFFLANVAVSLLVMTGLFYMDFNRRIPPTRLPADDKCRRILHGRAPCFPLVIVATVAVMELAPLSPEALSRSRTRRRQSSGSSLAVAIIGSLYFRNKIIKPGFRFSDPG